MASLDRRTLLLGATAGLAATLNGCTQGPPASHPAPASSTPETSMRALLVYFSRPGENYWHGGRKDLEIGNTRIVAEMIAEQTGAQVFRIEAAEAYPHDYEQTVQRNEQEQQDDARPKISDELPDVSGYDTIIIGSPVWNTRAPMIIQTFLDATDALAGKTIHPFLTYAVGEGSVFADYATLCPDATVTDGLAIQGENAADAHEAVTRWVSAITGSR
ncbi:flavodoxin [Streptomyces sp. BH105]|uniref:flavodoxin n=1 Tax=Streptomyces sp. BH105 TaxID=3410408 RepID=UPI003CF78AE3